MKLDDHTIISLNPNNMDDINKICNLLENNYVEDVKNKFRYGYKPSFMQWYLNSFNTHNIGIIYENKLIGFICGRINNIMLMHNIKKITEIDFLCIDKKFRKHDLCPLLIKEITKYYINLVDDAIFTSEYKFNNTISNVKYFTKFINIKKLVDAEYIKTTTPVNIIEKIFDMPHITSNMTLIKAEEKDIDECFKLYNIYFQKFDLYEILTKDEFKKMFFNPHINLYKLVDNNIIIDFISYYMIDIFVLQKNTKLRDSFMFYYTNITNNLKIMIYLLINKLDNNIDTFIVSNIMDTDNTILNDLKFYETNDKTTYYFQKETININNNKLAKILF